MHMKGTIETIEPKPLHLQYSNIMTERKLKRQLGQARKEYHCNFTYEQKVEDGAKDRVEDDGPEVAHEHPVVEGVGRLCTEDQHHSSQFANFHFTHCIIEE